MGVFTNTGVSLQLSNSVTVGRGYLSDLTDRVGSWTHVGSAIGGYLSGSCTLFGDADYISEWIESGLGRWITLYNEGGDIRWRGFVDTIAANIGGLQITRGPLSGIGNRTQVVYSTVDTSTTPPTVGVRARTAQTNDTASQGIYGIWQKILSTGGASAATAAQVQAMYQQENSVPQTTKTIAPGGGNISLALSLRGAWYWLMAFVANFTTAGTVNLSDRLAAILALDPNGVFNTTTAYITANTYQVPAYANDDKPALSYIQELLNPGDAAFNRYVAGFYQDDVFHYEAQSQVVTQYYSLSDPAQEITDAGGNVIRPWDVQPATWTQIKDLMVGRVSDTTLLNDPRNIFAEQVTYIAPYGLQINGAKVSTLAQVLAQKGLGGIGV